MNDPSITELLQSLPDRIDPDPDFSASLRAAVATELEVGAQRSVLELAEEGKTVSISTTDTPTPRFDPRLLAVAAVVVIAAVVAAIFVAQSGDEAGVADDGRDEVLVDDGTTFVGGSVDSFPVEADQRNPYRVTTTDGAVWTMSLDGTLVKRDPDTLAALQEVTINPSSVIAGSTDAIWVADATTGDVVRIDADTGETVATISTEIEVVPNAFRWGRPGMFGGVRVDLARIGWVAATADAVWVSDLDGRLLRIDPESNEIVDEIDVSIEAHFLRADDRYLLLGDQVDERVQVLEIESGDVIAEVSPINLLVGAELHGGNAYVLEAGDTDTFDAPAIVTMIDLDTGDRVITESVGELRKSSPDVPTFSPSLVVGNAGVLVPTMTELVVLDRTTLDVLDRLPAESIAGSATVGSDGTAWVAVFQGSMVHRVRPVER